MPRPELPAARLKPLATRRLREIFSAPELERYLAPGSVDLSLTDEVEAVRVRVLRGVEVVEERTLTGIAAGLRRQGWILAGIGFAAGAMVAVLLAESSSFGAVSVLLVALATGSLVVSGWRLVRLRRDLDVFRQLHGRYRRAVQECKDLDALLNLSQRIYEETCLVGSRRREE